MVMACTMKDLYHFILDIVLLLLSNGGRVGIWAPAHWGLGEIDGLLVPPGKASKLLTDHLITAHV